MSVREKKILAEAAFLLRANDKFSDNRHVLIDVSAPLTQTTGGLHQGDERYEEFGICTAHGSLYCTDSFPIYPTLKALMHSAGSLWDNATCSQSLHEVDGTCCPISTMPLLDWVKSSTIRTASCLIARQPPQCAALWRGLMYL